MAVIENFYRKLYSQSVPEPDYLQEVRDRVIRNVGSEDIPEIDMMELRTALQQMRNRKAPGEDQVTSEMLKTGGETLDRALLILMNKCLEEGRIPDAWRNAEDHHPLQEGRLDEH